MTLTWIRTKYGERCQLGVYTVAEYNWAVLTKEERLRPYRVQLRLPGIVVKSGKDRQETEEAARALIERAVKVWVERAGLTFNGGPT